MRLTTVQHHVLSVYARVTRYKESLQWQKRRPTTSSSRSRTKTSNTSTFGSAICPASSSTSRFRLRFSIESVFEDGLAFDGSSVRGFQSIHESDMMLLPDPDTARIDPFRAAKTLNLNFFVHDPFTREAYSRDPRNVARKAENYLASTGIADTCLLRRRGRVLHLRLGVVRLEDERHLLRDRLRGRLVEHWRAGRGRRQRQPRLQGPSQGRLLPRRALRPLRRPARCDVHQPAERRVRAGEGPPRGRHAGQAEINYKFNTLLHAADDLQLYKYIIKNTAWQAGKTVTFMPKPLFGDNGSGMHCPPVTVEGRQPAVPRRVRLRGPVGHRAPLHRRHPAPRAFAAGVHQPDGELLQAAGAGL